MTRLPFLLAYAATLAGQQPDPAASVELQPPASALNAGIPQFVRFSGELRSPGGQSLTGTVVIRFAVYQEQSGDRRSRCQPESSLHAGAVQPIY